MSGGARPVPSAAWQAALRARVDRPPARAREPLRWQGHAIGSVEPEFASRIGREGAPELLGLLQKDEHPSSPGWAVTGELTASLGAIANFMRAAGLAHAWRDEQLAVRDAQGGLLGTVERACVRPLGVPTRAVHLVAFAPDGRHWLQRRALTKPNDPGKWDTLVGGMVPATDTLDRALERETAEEAGLALGQLERLAHGGFVRLRGPSAVPHGYVEERIDWWRCVLPDGVLPRNTDGEVMEFACLDADEVRARLEAGDFTDEAALLLLAAGL